MEVLPRSNSPELVTTFPLNSRKVTARVVRALAEKLGLPTSGTREDTLQIVIGKLQDDGKVPSNVQVTIHDIHIALQDDEGQFLETEFVATQDEEPQDDVEAISLAGSETEGTVEQLPEELRRLSEERMALEATVAERDREIQRQKDRYKQLWSKNCLLLSTVEDKEEEICLLKEKISLPEGAPGPTQVGTLTGTQTSQSQGYRRGTAPPVDPFSGDRPDLSFEDWLPSLERAATWNGWTNDEMLLQLAGYLRGKARQEWNLMEEGSVRTLQGLLRP